MCNHQYNQDRRFLSPWNRNPNHWPLAITHVMFVPLALPAPACHTDGSNSIQRFESGLFLVMPLRFIVLLHVSVLHAWRYCNLFIHSLADGHLGCFLFWTIVSKAAYKESRIDFCVTIGFHFTWVSISKWDCWVVWWMYV